MSNHLPLTSDTVAAALADLPGWIHEENKIKKSFTFSSFREAISFLVRLSFEAESLNHHPEIFNVYNTLDVAITTHDAGHRVTEKDLELARAIEHFSWT